MVVKTDSEWHRKMAAHLFNATWVLLEKKGRSKKDSITMIHMAHASRYHWGVVGGPKVLAIGEWQISRVYAVLRRPEPALYHAQRALQNRGPSGPPRTRQTPAVPDHSGSARRISTR